jgi:hypothetical protein
MKRTLALIVVSGIGAAAYANIAGGSMAGGAFLQAGSAFEDHAFGVPASETYTLEAPPEGAGSASTVAKVITQATSDSVMFDFDVTTLGAAENLGGADVFVEFTLVDAANFLLEGDLSGLTFFQSTIQGVDNDFVLVDELFFDQFGYFGTLVDGQGNPVPQFSRQGVLEAGTYTFALSAFSEALPGAGAFDGQGRLSLSLTAIPAPSAALALGAPSLFALRRRR